MPLTNRERELYEILEVYLEDLQQRRGIDPSGLKRFGDVDAAVRRWLQLAIQCCLDIGDSVLGRVGVPEPPRSQDIFPALERKGLIPPEITRQMVELTKFRNELAYAYSHLTPAGTWHHLREGLPVMTRFARLMEQV